MADVLTVESGSSMSASRIPDIVRRTAPWVRLMSVVLFISCAFMVIGAAIFAVTIAVGLGVSADRPAGAVPVAIVALVYACFGLINLIPAVFLMRFAGRAKAFVAAQTVQHLEEALDAQRSYWKFMGIFMIVGIGLALCVFVVAAVAGFWAFRSAAGR